MPITIGEPLPEHNFKALIEGVPSDKTTADIFAGKTVVLFAVPGAFTPTCHTKHLPGFLANTAKFNAKGVHTLACLSVNDPYVMAEWAKVTGGARHVMFLADGDASFTKAIGLSKEFGVLGLRSQRYAMLVKNGIVTVLNLEEKSGVDVSSAETMLKAL
jgi:glutaredoxin/glutathione-dependent peroxiredoxin